jgi:hypothetical protein
MGSFYDLDYIIEINKERLNQYSEVYQKTMDKFTNILILYSAFTIFLIPIVQTLFFDEAKCYWLYHVSFYIFIISFSISLINTIYLLTPVKVTHLLKPEVYYKEYRSDFEDGVRIKSEIDRLLKEAYVDELEEAVNENEKILNKKKSFYLNAFIFALLSAIPYLICLFFQLSMKGNHFK